MSNQTSFFNCSTSGSETHFSGVFEDNPSKFASLALAVVATPLNTVLLFGIIWFEHFGSDQKRILTNKRLSSVCWTWIFGMTVCFVDVLRYLVGPFPKSLCMVLVIAKNVAKTQVVLFFDAIVIVRFIFIFCLKNPGRVNDDFWSVFANCWISGMSVAVNFVVYSLPIRQPVHFYVCADLDPRPFSAHPLKVPAVLEVSSVALHLILKLSIIAFKPKFGPSVDNHPRTRCIKGEFLASLEQQSIADFTSNILAMICLTLLSLYSILTNSLIKPEINEYPNYLYLYFLQFVFPCLVSFLIPTVHYLRSPQLRKTVMREAIQIFR